MRWADTIQTKAILAILLERDLLQRYLHQWLAGTNFVSGRASLCQNNMRALARQIDRNNREVHCGFRLAFRIA